MSYVGLWTLGQIFLSHQIVVRAILAELQHGNALRKHQQRPGRTTAPGTRPANRQQRRKKR